MRAPSAVSYTHLDVYKRQPRAREQRPLGRDRLERLVSGLKRLVGYRIERRTIDVADLSSRTELLLRDTLGARTLDLDVPGHAALRCDPDQIRQVLVNLVSNALEASGPDGRVGIAWDESSPGATLAVWDDGPGYEGDVSHPVSYTHLEHLRQALHHVRAPEDATPEVHELGHRATLTNELEDLRCDKSNGLRIVEPEPTCQALLGDHSGPVQQEFVQVARSEVHRATALPIARRASPLSSERIVTE